MSFEIESFIKKAYFRLDVWATVLPFYWYLICVVWYMLFFIKIDFFTKKVTPQIWFFDYLIHVIFHLERFFFFRKGNSSDLVPGSLIPVAFPGSHLYPVFPYADHPHGNSRMAILLHWRWPHPRSKGIIYIQSNYVMNLINAPLICCCFFKYLVKIVYVYKLHNKYTFNRDLHSLFNWASDKEAPLNLCLSVRLYMRLRVC